MREIEGTVHKQSIMPVVNLPMKDVKGPAARGSYSNVDRLCHKPGTMRTGAAVYFAGIILLYAKPLAQLAGFAYFSDTYSHILLIPILSGYLIWLKRVELNLALGSFWVYGLPMLLGLSSIAAYGGLSLLGTPLSLTDYLSLLTFSFVCLVVAGFGLFLGARNLRKIIFPAAMLLFMVPFPDFFMAWIEKFLQHTSADAAYAMISISGCPVFRQGLSFQLPSIALTVSGECSGIRSSLVLLITSLYAGHLFLSSPWRRSVLALAVIPLGIIRNGFRIFTIAMLCVHVDPDMLSSWIHRRGGPIFFVVSLVPFFILLLLLRKSETQKHRVSSHV